MKGHAAAVRIGRVAPGLHREDPADGPDGLDGRQLRALGRTADHGADPVPPGRQRSSTRSYAHGRHDACPARPSCPPGTCWPPQGGQFRDAAWVNGAPSVLRQPDGIHFTVVGENVLATYVAQRDRGDLPRAVFAAARPWPSPAETTVSGRWRGARSAASRPTRSPGRSPAPSPRPRRSWSSRRERRIGFSSRWYESHRAGEGAGHLDARARRVTCRRMDHLQGQHQPREVPQVERVGDVPDVAHRPHRQPRRRRRRAALRVAGPEQHRRRAAGPPREHPGVDAGGVEPQHRQREHRDGDPTRRRRSRVECAGPTPRAAPPPGPRGPISQNRVNGE